jgi:hypothetical protein
VRLRYRDYVSVGLEYGVAGISLSIRYTNYSDQIYLGNHLFIEKLHCKTGNQTPERMIYYSGTLATSP